MARTWMTDVAGAGSDRTFPGDGALWGTRQARLLSASFAERALPSPNDSPRTGSPAALNNATPPPSPSAPKHLLTKYRAPPASLGAYADIAGCTATGDLLRLLLTLLACTDGTSGHCVSVHCTSYSTIRQTALTPVLLGAARQCLRAGSFRLLPYASAIHWRGAASWAAQNRLQAGLSERLQYALRPRCCAAKTCRTKGKSHSVSGAAAALLWDLYADLLDLLIHPADQDRRHGAAERPVNLDPRRLKR